MSVNCELRHWTPSPTATPLRRKEATEKHNMDKNDRKPFYTECKSCGLLNIVCWKVTLVSASLLATDCVYLSGWARAFSSFPISCWHSRKGIVVVAVGLLHHIYVFIEVARRFWTPFWLVSPLLVRECGMKQNDVDGRICERQRAVITGWVMSVCRLGAQHSVTLVTDTAPISAVKAIKDVQGEQKVFHWLQTFITRKLRGIQTFFCHYLS